MNNLTLKVGKPYYAILKEVKEDYDYLLRLPKVLFIYKVYINKEETCEVIDEIGFYYSAVCQLGTEKKIRNLSENYNFYLTKWDFRNEFTFAKAWQGLTGTEVVIKPYNYKGKQKIKVIGTYRNHSELLFKLKYSLTHDKEL